MSAKRIVIFGWSTSVHIGRWVAGLHRRGYEIKVISLGGRSIDDVETVILPRKSRLSYIMQSGRAAEEARKFKPDLVHVHYAVGFGVWGLRTRISPWVVSVWGADVIDFPTNPLNGWLVKRVLNSADYITATSQLLRKATLKLAPEVSPRLKVIPFGVNIPDQVSPLPPAIPPKLCFVKVHYKKYGPDILLRAMVRVKERIPNIKLSIAGEGELTPLLKSMTVELGLENNVEFAGFIDNRKVYSFIRRHHFMVMPSVMESESFGVAVLESSACGRPVIASRIGGVPEVLQHEKTGILITPGSVDELAAAIIELAENPALCEELGQAGYQYVREFYDWEKSLDSMAELYERLIDAKK